ncbi:MAG: tRNA pseudouridine(38-40) synthase TruA [Actinobacteria bacterium RBG_16_67_10]|nr:MAG: tRNA pseudouridine(38-40) synthase TruA [Actinobacteria bacterium RBG_16_67_10]
MASYRIDLAYDGSGFHGYARNSGVRTVQEELEHALATAFGSAVDTQVAGRTDSGVHARGQVVSFEAESGLNVDALARSVNAILGPEIVVQSVSRAEDGFDARFSALSRSYRYFVDDGPAPNPLDRHTVWHVDWALDEGALARAASAFVGEHDFASFCRAADGRTTIRNVTACSWSRESPDVSAPNGRVIHPGLLVFSVTATAFCHQMVRSLVALSVDIGRGRIAPDAIPGIFEARDRNAARGVAPPHGLVLWDVEY